MDHREPEVVDASALAGVPDELQRLWTPFRMAYIDGENKPTDSSAGECPFCHAPRVADEESLIVRRGRLAYAVLNLYPYNPGHLLICPYRHVSDYVDLDAEETAEFTELTRQALRVIGAVSAPAGFNVGINQGTAAGAGIAAHLHQHVVPRWSGDSNFLPIIGHTKALPQLLGDTRQRLAEGWAELYGTADRSADTHA